MSDISKPQVRKVVCPLCEGHRLMGGVCGECKGTGYVEDANTVHPWDYYVKKQDEKKEED